MTSRSCFHLSRPRVIAPRVPAFADLGIAAFKGGRKAARQYQDIEDQVREGSLTAADGADALAELLGLKDPE